MVDLTTFCNLHGAVPVVQRVTDSAIHFDCARCVAGEPPSQTPLEIAAARHRRGTETLDAVIAAARAEERRACAEIVEDEAYLPTGPHTAILQEVSWRIQERTPGFKRPAGAGGYTITMNTIELAGGQVRVATATAKEDE